MKNLIKNNVILVIVFILAYFSAVFVGDYYEKLFPGPSSIFLGDFRFIIGFPLIYTFFLTFLFTAFGDSKKYWWIGILLIPAAIFELYFDLEHIYFPIIIGSAGWLVGLFVQRMLSKFLNQS